MSGNFNENQELTCCFCGEGLLLKAQVFQNTNLKICTSILLIFVSQFWHTQSVAQTQFASIKFGETKDMRLFNLGDSILVSYLLQNNNFHGSVIVRNDGSYKTFFVGDIAAQFCGSELKGDQWFLYFLERKDKRTLLLRTLLVDKKNKVRKILDNGIAIDGRLIGVREKNGISVFTWKKSDRLLSIYKASGGENSESSYQLPENTAILDDYDFQLMPLYPGWLYQSYTMAKIYFTEQLRVTIDRNDRTELISFNEGEKNYKVTTIRTDSTERRASIYDSESAHSSFLYDSLLFRLNVLSGGIKLKVYNTENGLTVASQSLYKRIVGDSDKIYFHSGKDDVTHRQEKLKRMISSYDLGAEPAIVVNRLEGENYCVTLGSFFNGKGIGVVPNLNPVAMIVGSLVVTAMKQARHAPAISRYMYANFDGKQIDFKNEPSVVFKAIDDIDITKQKRSTIEDVLIKDPQNAIIALNDLKSKTLQLIRVHSK